jgi:thioredoxin-like negative regulator of GroEL
MDKAVKNQKQNPPAPGSPKPSAPARIPSRVPPLFRSIDWAALAFTFAVVWFVYFLTLAPEVTLEDSGELCTGSFYAGIPHPPGYPFWAIYSWLWTKLLPFGNVAWRVEVGGATAAAMACGLVALMVSRGSSMLMEGIEELKSLTGKWESAICLVSGTVAGLLLGFGSVMWSESVVINRISPFGVPWVMLVLTCLLRWIYAPHQRRYLYWAMFFFGICATIHQTLLVAAMGIEVAIAVAQPRLGRNLFLGNSILFLLGWLAQSTGLTSALDTAKMVIYLYNIIGITSILAYFGYAIYTKETLKELGRDAALAAFFLLMVATRTSMGNLALLLGLAALAAFVWLAWDTRKLGLEWLVAIVLGLLWILGASFYFYEPIAGMTNPPMQWGYPRTVEGFFHALSRGQYEKANPSDVFSDPNRFIMQLGILVGDVAHEFNWVVVFVALVPLLFFFKMQKRERAWICGLTGIYLCIGVLLMILMNPSTERQSADLIKVFFASSHAVIAVMFGYGLALTAAYMATHYQQFRVIGLMLGIVTLVPALITFYDGVNSTFFGTAVWIPYRSVFYLFLCLAATFVLTALAAQSYLRISRNPAGVPQNERLLLVAFSFVALICLSLSAGLAFFSRHSLSLNQAWSALLRVFVPNQFSLPVVAGFLILSLAVVFIGALIVYRRRAPLAITLGIFALMPLASGLCHWWGSEQRNHWFGYWFGHDMFTPPFNGSDGKPLYPVMAKDTILYGGTDPGRFCPTYMIFCESFIPHHCQPPLDQNFDRRDVYLITQNALADGTYLCYLRAQYFRSQQIDPPFFSELARTVLKDKDYETNLLARLVSPLDTFFTARGARIEKRWRTYTSWFTDTDFVKLPDFSARLRPGDRQDPLSQWLYRNFSKETQDLLARQGDERHLRSALAADLNRLLERELLVKKEIKTRQKEKDRVDQQLVEGNTSNRLRQRQEQLTREIAGLKVEPLYDTNRFAHVKISEYLAKFIAQNPQSDTRIRLNRLLLEAAYPDEIAPSLGGVYPDREIYIPYPEDSQRCFSEYIADASARLQHDQQYPNEPRQIKPGEGVNYDERSGRVQVSGQVAVMSINGLLTKVIFDHNPDNEFYIEESFPLDWMYPHLTPYGIIMKINRKPLPELTDDIVQRDHEFWSKFSDRMIGNWITYDTPVSNIVSWIEKVYLRRDFNGFTGDRKFVRDDQAQKAFSKLRSSIAGIYAWRLGMAASSPTPPQYLPKNDAERQRMIKEADFAFRQAFAFCPYSPEAVFRYVQLLMNLGRVEDALMIAQTCRKFDPENGQVISLIEQLEGYKRTPNTALQIRSQVQQLEGELRANPDDFSKAFELASRYMQLQQTDRAIQILDAVVESPHAQVGPVLAVAQFYAQMNNVQKLEPTLQKLVALAPNEPEAWYNLAATKAVIGKSTEALQALARAVDLSSQRLSKDPKAHDLRAQAETDNRFATLRATPGFRSLVPAK